MSASRPTMIAADWGTSNLRLWLLNASGEPVAERISGLGLSQVDKGEFDRVFEAELAAMQAPAGLPAVVCGMAGARQGWIEAPYVKTPAALSEVMSGSVQVAGASRSVTVIPGVAQSDQNAPNVMRGEETQLAGIREIATGDHWVCLPGTHSKWVQVSGGRITQFSTFMTGELFHALANATVLRHSLGAARSAVSAADPVFASWAVKAIAAPELITSRLFEIRAGDLLGKLDPASADAALSGLLIGTEAAAAARLPGDGQRTIRLVASGTLAALYRSVLEMAGFQVAVSDSDAAVRAGLFAAANAANQRSAIGL